MRTYKILSQNKYKVSDFSIVPIRNEDRYMIMKWRNEQLYHLRQQKPLTKQDQDNYFNNTVAKLFDSDCPEQVLFSFLEGERCIGYGGLVHINWIDKNAEISFIMDTALEKNQFEKYWSRYLELIEQVAFKDLMFHKIFTYAFDIRPKVIFVLEKYGYLKEAMLKEHKLFNNRYIDILIHSKFRCSDKN